MSRDLVNLLKKQHLTLSVAESLTAGKVQDLVVQTPGASKVFKGGVTAYTEEMKRQLLEVEWTLLMAKGAVDPEVAFEMAKGVQKLFNTDCAISTTGFADGEAKTTPVGLVYACALAPNRRPKVQEFRFDPSLSREEIRQLAAKEAVGLLVGLLQ